MISEVDEGHREVKKVSADTTISCKISGAADDAKVEWLDGAGKPVTSPTYTEKEGNKDGNGNQESTLVVLKASVDQDTDYTCRVTSKTYTDSAPSDTIVHLNVYGEIQQRM